jgi:polar amino acid transport system substrate-binding protein
VLKQVKCQQTRRLRRLLAGSLLLASAVAALTACGEKGSESPTTGATVTTSVDATLAAAVPDKVKSDGTIKIGVDPSYAPAEFLDTDGQTVIGFDIDLFDLVAQRLGLTTVWVPAKFDDIIPGVQSGKYEIGVSAFTINAERVQQVNMVSYFAAGTQWAARAGSTITPDNACGLKVAVQTGTVQVQDLTNRSDQCVTTGKPAIQINQFQSQADATASVVTGKTMAMSADSPVSAYAVKQTNGVLGLMGAIYASAPYGYVLPKSELDFATTLRKAVQAVIDESSYRAVLDGWGVGNGAIAISAVNP